MSCAAVSADQQKIKRLHSAGSSAQGLLRIILCRSAHCQLNAVVKRAMRPKTVAGITNKPRVAWRTMDNNAPRKEARSAASIKPVYGRFVLTWLLACSRRARDDARLSPAAQS